METFGEWLRQRRDGLGLTRKELAERVGCSVSTLRKIEEGERRPSGQVAGLLANCLEVPTGERSTFLRVARGELNAERLRRERALHSSTDSSSPKTNLPIFPTPLIGRDREVEQLCQLLRDPQCRLLTLVGPGGVGKTRLAIEAASQPQDAFADGVYFVSLAPVSSLNEVVSTAANAVHFAFHGPSDPKEQLVNYLRHRQMLLVVDNVEHLLANGPQEETALALLIEIAQHAAQVKLLTTSRESLGLQAEWIFEVQGLPIPESIDVQESAQNTSVELFVQRGRRAHTGYGFTVQDYPSILRICQLVDGNPLAIELAAAWVRTLSCREIAGELERGLDFLSVSTRDVPARHRSMRAVFDHSWKLLTEEEQRVLLRLSVFRGGMQRDAAEAVAGATLSLLATLQSKSFLRRAPTGRYDLHELVRQYVADRLAQVPEEEAEARDRHSAYYTDYVARLEGELKGAEQLHARAALDADIDNIRAGWRWAVQQGHTADVRKSIRALWYFYDMRCWYLEAEASLAWATEKMDTAERAGNAADGRAAALREYLRAMLGWFYVRRGKLEKADVLLQSSLASLRSFATGVELADVLYYAGAAAWMSGDYPRARTQFQEGLAVAEQFGSQWDIGLASIGMGIITQSIGEYDEAQQHWQRALAIYRGLGDKRGMASALNFSSILKRTLGAHAEAQACLRECLTLSESVGDRVTYGMALSQLGLVTQALGDHAEAADLLDESVALLRELGEFWSLLHALIGLGAATLSIGDYAASRAAYHEALRMAWERQALPEVVEAMTGMARWSAEQGAPEQALVSAFFVLNHPGATEQTKEAARQLRAELEAQLPSTRVEAIHTRCQDKTLEAVVEDLLT
jgi:predicted ATPase/DNA-binding XRE family transcriptional regulator